MVSYKREFEIILYAVNAKRPISVTDSGMVIEESDVQLENAFLPIYLVLLGMYNADNLKQPINALSPIFLTPS